MTFKYCAIDFEFKDSNNPLYTLVSAALTDGTTSASMWLHEQEEKQHKLKQYLLGIRDTHVLLSWAVSAEARSMVSLGLNPIKFKWIDLQAEYKMLTNHNDKLGYGKQLIINKDKGTLKTTSRKQWGIEDGKPHDKCSTALLAATYKLLGTVGPKDVAFKAKMRDIILKNKTYTQDQKDEILGYGSKDISELHDLYLAMMKEYRRLLKKPQMELLHSEMLYRGETVARAAVMESIGYPVNREKVINFAKNVPQILIDVQEDINSQFPAIKPFIWKKKEGRYGWRQKVTKDWLRDNLDVEGWLLTDTGDLSLSMEAFEKRYSYRHNYPRENFPAQILRYLRLVKSLNGFKPKSVTAQNTDTFFSYYGADDRAHPYLNSYGSQSARYQPKATGFMHLKSAWMRSLVEPSKGRVIAGLDYSSEEFILAGLVANDKNMISAYRSGDVYLYFAKLAGAVPWEGTKEEYKQDRDRFKSTVLGISYQMGAKALAAKITADTGTLTSQKEAQELIYKFVEAFETYADWIDGTEYDYETQGHLKLPCGFYMFGDNDNKRSISNMPIQGLGSSILRKAIAMAQDRGLEVILPLHDALYIEFNYGEWDKIDILEGCMREAFGFYFEGEIKELAIELIRIDCDVWGPDFSETKTIHTPKGLTVKAQKIYVDDRAGEEYEQFRKYFLTQVSK